MKIRETIAIKTSNLEATMDKNLGWLSSVLSISQPTETTLYQRYLNIVGDIVGRSITISGIYTKEMSINQKSMFLGANETPNFDSIVSLIFQIVSVVLYVRNVKEKPSSLLVAINDDANIIDPSSIGQTAVFDALADFLASEDSILVIEKSNHELLSNI